MRAAPRRASRPGHVESAAGARAAPVGARPPAALDGTVTRVVTRTPNLGPWFYATRLVECPRCGAAIGEPCTEHDRDRAQYHLDRYELARARAGFPLKRRDTEPIPS